MRAVGTPYPGNSQPLYTRGAELALGMDYCDLLGGRHPREGILHPGFERQRIVEICRCTGMRHTGGAYQKRRYGFKSGFHILICQLSTSVNYRP